MKVKNRIWKLALEQAMEQLQVKMKSLDRSVFQTNRRIDNLIELIDVLQREVEKNGR